MKNNSESEPSRGMNDFWLNNTWNIITFYTLISTHIVYSSQGFTSDSDFPISNSNF